MIRDELVTISDCSVSDSNLSRFGGCFELFFDDFFLGMFDHFDWFSFVEVVSDSSVWASVSTSFDLVYGATYNPISTFSIWSNKFMCYFWNWVSDIWSTFVFNSSIVLIKSFLSASSFNISSEFSWFSAIKCWLMSYCSFKLYSRFMISSAIRSFCSSSSNYDSSSDFEHFWHNASSTASPLNLDSFFIFF